MKVAVCVPGGAEPHGAVVVSDALRTDLDIVASGLTMAALPENVRRNRAHWD
jgi:hypothetical protein